MLLTPEFNLSQNDITVFVEVRAPFAKIQDSEINAHGNDFYFFSRPYHLHLKLPGRIVALEEIQDESQENNNSVVKYDVDRQVFDIALQKADPGEFFEGLGLITNLLASLPVAASLAPAHNSDENKRSRPLLSGQLIEEIESATPEPSSEGVKESMAIPPGFSWSRNATNKDEEGDEDDSDSDCERIADGVDLRSVHAFGFGNRFHGEKDCTRFAAIQESFAEVVDFRVSISALPQAKRFLLKCEKEKEDFCPDHYLANLCDEEDRKVIKCEILTQKLPDSLAGPLSSEQRKEVIEKLKNRSYLLDFDEFVSCFLSLVDILFAYCYDLRVTQGEHCAESAWNISKLSSTLSWFCEFQSLRSVQIACFRRSLTYPLYRYFELSQECWKDTIELLKMGQVSVFKVLLDIRRIFAVFDSSSSPKYILNDLYINDYCIWIQKVNANDIAELANSCAKLKYPLKSDLGFELDLIEDSALLTLQEEIDEGNLDEIFVKEVAMSCSVGRRIISGKSKQTSLNKCFKNLSISC